MNIEFSNNFIQALKNAKSVVVSTGAGVSAESGVPTFRGEDGLWKKFRAEELATFEAFDANPELVWEWYRFRRDVISKIKPNAGHYAIAGMPELFDEFHLITQNIDNLHRVAGSDGFVELHGNINRNRCVDCGEMNYDKEFADFPPRCRCGGRLRPDVVWFGELLPPGAIEEDSGCRAPAIYCLRWAPRGSFSPRRLCPPRPNSTGRSWWRSIPTPPS
jgi:NAD-dependent deacetylase